MLDKIDTKTIQHREDAGWARMRSQLDIEMPEKRKKDRGILWLFIFIGFGFMGGIYTANKYWTNSKVPGSDALPTEKVPVDKADRAIASKGNAGSNKGTMEILSKDESKVENQNMNDDKTTSPSEIKETYDKQPRSKNRVRVNQKTNPNEIQQNKSIATENKENLHQKLASNHTSSNQKNNTDFFEPRNAKPAQQYKEKLKVNDKKEVSVAHGLNLPADHSSPIHNKTAEMNSKAESDQKFMGEFHAANETGSPAMKVQQRQNFNIPQLKNYDKIVIPDATLIVLPKLSLINLPMSEYRIKKQTPFSLKLIYDHYGNFNTFVNLGLGFEKSISRKFYAAAQAAIGIQLNTFNQNINLISNSSGNSSPTFGTGSTSVRLDAAASASNGKILVDPSSTNLRFSGDSLIIGYNNKVQYSQSNSIVAQTSVGLGYNINKRISLEGGLSIRKLISNHGEKLSISVPKNAGGTDFTNYQVQLTGTQWIRFISGMYIKTNYRFTDRFFLTVGYSSGKLNPFSIVSPSLVYAAADITNSGKLSQNATISSFGNNILNSGYFSGGLSFRF